MRASENGKTSVHSRNRTVLLFLLPYFVFVVLGCGNDRSRKIQRVVIIFQENRTPDNLLHGLRSADIANTGLNSNREIIPLTPVPLRTSCDLNHTHKAFMLMYDGGNMDGADQIAGSGAVLPVLSSGMWYRATLSHISNWLSNTLSATGCSKPTRGQAFPPINTSSQALPHQLPIASHLLLKM